MRTTETTTVRRSLLAIAWFILRVVLLDSALRYLYFPTPVRDIACPVPLIVSMAVLVPLSVGLNITDKVHVAPASMVCPQSVVSVKSVEALPCSLMPEIVSTAGVSLEMTTGSGRLSVSTGLSANQIAERDKRIFRGGPVDGETCHQVAALVGASELRRFLNQGEEKKEREKRIHRNYR